MASELGKAYVQIVPSAKGISAAITDEIEPGVKESGKSSGRSFFSSFKGVLTTVGLAKTVWDSLSAGADLQQSLGGVETLFKDSAETIKKYANEAYKTTGLSANDYMQNVTGFSASLLQSLGGDTQKAAEIAHTAMVDMADNSNKMGTSMESIQVAYQGFAKQNYTMLDNLKLGYGGTKTEMERLLKDAKKISGIKYDISNLSDVYSAIHVIQGELNITGTAAKESASTFSGAFASMKASFTNFMAALSLGQDVAPALSNLLSSIGTFLIGNLAPMLGNILMSIPTVIWTLLPTIMSQILELGGMLLDGISTGFSTQLPFLVDQIIFLIDQINLWISEQLPKILDSGVKIITELANGIMSNLPSLLEKGGEVFIKLIEGFMSFMPTILNAGVELINNLISGIAKNLPNIIHSMVNVLSKLISTIISKYPEYFSRGIEIIGKMASGIIQNIPAIVSALFGGLVELIGTIIGKLPEFLSMGINILTQMGAGIVQAIPKLLSLIPGLIGDLVGAFASLPGKMVQVGIDMLGGLAKGIADAAAGTIQAAIDFAGDILGGVLGFFGIHSPSTVFAEIGYFLDAGLAQGIEDNLKPISKAMDLVEAEATRSFENDLSMNVSKSMSELDALLKDSGISTEGDKPFYLNLVIAGRTFRAFIEDISKTQNELIDLELSY